jgi:hypothetical protein
MAYNLIYQRNEHPFGKSWEEWAASWCNWMLSIPKKKNPSRDRNGRYSSVDQKNPNVWFLTGTFGNIVLVKRKCTIPTGRAIFLPVLVKEDSMAEDSDLKTEVELIARCKKATGKLINIEAAINNVKIDHLTNYRVRSEVFDLTFPEHNVYDVRPGRTRSVCDGYWLFIKPLRPGIHFLYFKGETWLDEPYTINKLKSNEIHKTIWQHIDRESKFKLEVLYELTISNELS